MKKWLRRIRGAIGMGLTWAVAWGGAGSLMMLGFRLFAGSRPDAPFPILFTAFGFVAGVTVSGVLGLAEGRRRFDQMSLARFAGWGAAGGFVLSAAFVGAVMLAGDHAFLRNLVVLGPVLALGGAGSAAGTLVLAKKGRDRELSVTPEPGALSPHRGTGSSASANGPTAPQQGRSSGPRPTKSGGGSSVD